MDNIEVLKELFDPKKIDVLKVFFANQEKQFYLKEISDSVKVPMASTHRILKRLVKAEIITETSISKFKVYQIAKNEKTQFLSTFIKISFKGVDEFVKRAKGIKGLRRIILHGKESDSRASILLIGDGIDDSVVKRIASEIKENHNYTITHMTLTEEQYDQMSNMGLYSGTKKLLLEQ
jgi:predicted transcriptional regulator